MDEGISLKKLYEHIYPPSGFAITYTEELLEKLNIICIISKFLSFEELSSILARFNFKLMKSSKEFSTFETYYKDPKTNSNIKVIYHLHIDKKRELLIFFTTNSKTDIERTLIPLIEQYYGFYYLFINPKLFQEIQNRIFSENPDTTIPYFTAYRKPHFKFLCRIRPEEKRTITYQGSDGRETLEEFKQFYGMLPHIIEFRIPDVIQFRIDFRGIFSFKSGNIDYIDSIVNLVLETILRSKKIVERSKLEYVPIQTENKTLQIPKPNPWLIRFSTPIKFEDLGTIMTLLSKENNFAVFDYYAEKGSVFWTANVLDILKHCLFTIKSNGEKIFVLPRYNSAFDSFLRFYHFFTENIDAEATIEEMK